MKSALMTLMFAFMFAGQVSASENPCSKLMASDCWSSFGILEKIALIQGISLGQSVKSIQGDISGSNNSTLFQRDHVAVPDSTTYGDVIDYIDKLYSFPVNRSITLDKAFVLATLYLRDDDSNDRINLLTLYRDGKNLPTSGILTGYKDLNVLTVEAYGVPFDVVLPRSSTLGISPETRAKGLNVLEKFVTYGFGDACSDEAYYVQLEYPGDLFDSKGRLRAEIKLSQYASICLSNKSVNFSSLNTFGDIHLGMFMLRNGFVSYDSEDDPMWSKDVKDGFRLYDILKDVKPKLDTLSNAVLMSLSN